MVPPEEHTTPGFCPVLRPGLSVSTFLAEKTGSLLDADWSAGCSISEMAVFFFLCTTPAFKKGCFDDFDWSVRFFRVLSDVIVLMPCRNTREVSKSGLGFRVEGSSPTVFAGPRFVVR